MLNFLHIIDSVASIVDFYLEKAFHLEMVQGQLLEPLEVFDLDYLHFHLDLHQEVQQLHHHRDLHCHHGIPAGIILEMNIYFHCMFSDKAFKTKKVQN